MHVGAQRVVVAVLGDVAAGRDESGEERRGEECEVNEVRKEGREGVRASQCLCAAVETVEGETRKDKGARRREETHRTQGSAW